MTKQPKPEKFDLAIDQFFELEQFLFPLLRFAATQKLKDGDDLLPIAKAAKLKVPKSLAGEELVWDTDFKYAEMREANKHSITIVRPGQPDALGLTIGCIRRGKWKFCLECGWLYCRIVISRRF